jgi:integrase
MQPLLPFPPPQPIPPPHLRLFGDETERVGPQSTLRECFTAFVLPDLDERTKATLDEYSSLLNHWEQLTRNGPVCSIEREMVKAFRKRLFNEPYKRGGKKHQRSPATVNKIMRTLAAAISPLWPADRHNPGGKGLVAFFAFPEPLPEQPTLPFVFSRKEMSALYLACDACRPTKGHRRSPLYDPRLWRAAIVLALNTGPRTWDLYQLRWPDVRFTDFKYGSVFYRARKTAKVQRPPLNRVARAHLEHLRSLRIDEEFVFPGFKKNKSFYAAWKRICAKAGVNADFEDFRKTCSTLHDDVVHGVGEWITGHGVRGVNAQNYQNPTRRIFRAVYGLKQPGEFRRGARALPPVAVTRASA